MSKPFFFGYGSLINRETHDYPDVSRAYVSGWKRQWKKTRLRKLAFLTVCEAPGVEIAGLIASVPRGDWAALDEREAAYLRAPVALRSDTGHQTAQMYRTKPEHDTDATDDHPIILSYLDTVLQGFHREFGEAGIADFIATTDGWDAPILDDRDDPIYARTQTLSRTERARVDDHLDGLGVRRIRRADL